MMDLTTKQVSIISFFFLFSDKLFFKIINCCRTNKEKKKKLSILFKTAKLLIYLPEKFNKNTLTDLYFIAFGFVFVFAEQILM